MPDRPRSAARHGGSLRRTALAATVPMAALAVVLAVVLAWPYLAAPTKLNEATDELTEALAVHDTARALFEQSVLWTTYPLVPADSREAIVDRLAAVDARLTGLLDRVTSERSRTLTTSGVEQLRQDARELEEIGGRILALTDAGRDATATQVVWERLTPALLAIADRTADTIREQEARFRTAVLEERGALVGFGPIRIETLGETITAATVAGERALTSARVALATTAETAFYVLGATSGDDDALVAAEFAHRSADRALQEIEAMSATPATLEQLERLHAAHDTMTEDARATIRELRQGDTAAAGRRLAERLLPTLTDELQPASEQLRAEQEGIVRERLAATWASSRRVQLAVGAGLVVVLGGLVLVAALVARRLLAPVMALHAAAWRVEGGDLDVRVETDRDDELGQLVHRFNAMVGGLAAARGAMVSDAIVATSSDLLLVVGDDGTIHWANASNSPIWPSVDALVGRHLTTLTGTPHGDGLTDLLDVGIRAGAAGPVEVVLRDREGGRLVAEAEARDLRDDPTVGGVVLTLHDVTDRHRYEEAMAEAHDAAVEASKTKSAFLATMSHEIRTPMNAVIGMAELLLGTELDEEQHRYVSGIRGAGDALLHLIDDVLDFSKIEAGQLELEEVDLDVDRLVREVVDLFRATVVTRGLAMTVEVDAAVPSRLRGDVARLRQVLVNLVSNALKFTEEGGVVVRVRPDTPLGYRFEVTDTGIGISEEAQERLFEAFVQADSSSTRRYGGTGLGLAICRQLVELMGGRIGLTSEPGSGSTFWLTLPLQPAGTVVPAEPATGGPWGGPTAAPADGPTTRRRLLVVEDSPGSQLVAVRTLERMGYDVDLATDGRQALEAIDRVVYDAVLMDGQMPTMDGFTATRELRRRELGTDRHLPVIALTAGVTTQERQRCRDAGMDDFVPKPLRVEQLQAALGRWLPTTPAAEAPSSAPPDRTAPDPEVVDGERWQQLLAMVGDDRDVLHRLVGLFAERAPERIARLREALAGGDPGELGAVAHTLMGAAGTIGAHRVAELAGALEEAIERGDPAGQRDLADRIERALVRSVEALADAVGRPAAPPDGA